MTTLIEQSAVPLGEILPSVSPVLPFKIEEDYCRVIPVGKVAHAIILASDYEWASQFRWHPVKLPNGIYVCRCEKKNGACRYLYLHRELLGNPKNRRVDHRNGNPLDCRRANLREATHQQNLFNRPMPRNNTTGFKGVHLRTDTKRYSAQLHYGSKIYHLGCFDSASEAARAYDRKAKEVFGEFAWLNFPEKEE